MLKHTYPLSQKMMNLEHVLHQELPADIPMATKFLLFVKGKH